MFIMKVKIRYECLYTLLQGPGGATVLHFASKNGDAITCLSLLNNNSFRSRVIVNQQDDGGLTPLVWAIENKHNAIARLVKNNIIIRMLFVLYYI